MKLLKKILWISGGFILLLTLIVGFLWFYLPRVQYGPCRELDQKQLELRMAYVEAAQAHLGSSEGTDAHHAIIDTYNAHEPLAQGYLVTYADNWCATFVSSVSIEQSLTEIIPTECSCERQISLWQQLDHWEETDTYLPLPGDIIYYDWNVRTLGDSTGWADHVGIVVGTHGPFIKIIEGNKDDTVSYRYICRWDLRIRGYGLPAFSELN